VPSDADAHGSLGPDPSCPDPSCPSVEQLMVAYQNGDAAAAQSLVDLLSGRLLAFFSSEMGNRPEADDMLQEAWLRVHRARHTYRSGEPLLPWMYAIARRVRVDNYRRRRRIERREVASDALEDSPGRSPGRSNDAPSFRELVAPLSESQREILLMLKVNGLSIEEVARATSSTVGAVKQKVHRAYDRLRASLTRPAVRRAGSGDAL
jgi:RNA polymerase sigma-70 factor, ECF subfamily